MLVQLTKPQGTEDSSGDRVGQCGVSSRINSVPVFIVLRSHSRDTATKWPSRLGTCLLDIQAPIMWLAGAPPSQRSFFVQQMFIEHLLCLLKAAFPRTKR